MLSKFQVVMKHINISTLSNNLLRTEATYSYSKPLRFLHKPKTSPFESTHYEKATERLCKSDSPKFSEKDTENRIQLKQHMLCSGDGAGIEITSKCKKKNLEFSESTSKFLKEEDENSLLICKKKREKYGSSTEVSNFTIPNIEEVQKPPISKEKDPGADKLHKKDTVMPMNSSRENKEIAKDKINVCASPFNKEVKDTHSHCEEKGQNNSKSPEGQIISSETIFNKNNANTIPCSKQKEQETTKQNRKECHVTINSSNRSIREKIMPENCKPHTEDTAISTQTQSNKEGNPSSICKEKGQLKNETDAITTAYFKDEKKYTCSECQQKEQADCNERTESTSNSPKSSTDQERKPTSVCQRQGKDGKSTSSSDRPAQMDALILSVENRDVCLCKMSVPSVIRKDEVAIKVHYAVANLTDLLVIDGKLGETADGVVPGREMSGIVCATGDGVKHVCAGDSVVVAPCQPMSLCKFCHGERHETCIKETCGKTFGMTRNGAWTSFTTVPANMVYKVDGELCMEQAALLPLLAQVMCTLSKVHVQPHWKILIQGCGLPGMLFALLLQQSGHERVSIWEDNPNRIEIINALCLDYPIISEADLDKTTIDLVLSNGGGAHVMQLAYESLSPHGQFIVFGETGKNGNAPRLSLLTSELSRRAVTVRGMPGTPVNPKNVPIPVANELLQLAKLGVAIRPLKDHQFALTQLTAGDINGVVFCVNK